MRSGFALLLTAGWAFTLFPMAGDAQTGVEGYRVKPSDVLTVAVWGEPELQGEVLVGPDGTFSFPLVGHVDANNRTAADLQETVGERLSTYINSPAVTVSIQQVNGNKIYVIGQVNGPGEFVMNPAVDVMQALSMAGGTTPFAALDDIQVLRRDASGQQTAIRFRYSDVIRGRNLEQNIVLQSGDVVVVP